MPDTSRLVFRKSSYSGATTQNCVEVADASGRAAIRDSRYPKGGALMFPITEWAAFLDEVKDGRL
ncbi:DUF397 domain-containing protein [Allosalinactinospora lopnorensis]|uniref:DUF397 domain-containing protein n=1 Tax=Allosalinactinospora lopnorensis TaxID=1352348 RepID=UPI000623C0A8|nr:DUF397 domain-containing protein [Allosalinactinospora lopnorensis]